MRVLSPSLPVTYLGYLCSHPCNFRLSWTVGPSQGHSASSTKVMALPGHVGLLKWVVDQQSEKVVVILAGL